MTAPKDKRTLVLEMFQRHLCPLMKISVSEETLDWLMSGYDFFEKEKKSKITRTVDYRSYKKCYDLDLYLNGVSWRIVELMLGLASSWKDNNQLVATIITRHIYETTAHVYYLISKLS